MIKRVERNTAERDRKKLLLDDRKIASSSRRYTLLCKLVSSFNFEILYILNIILSLLPKKMIHRDLIHICGLFSSIFCLLSCNICILFSRSVKINSPYVMKVFGLINCFILPKKFIEVLSFVKRFVTNM